LSEGLPELTNGHENPFMLVESDGCVRATAPAEIRHDRCYLFRVFEMHGEWGPRRRWGPWPP